MRYGSKTKKKSGISEGERRTALRMMDERRRAEASRAECSEEQGVFLPDISTCWNGEGTVRRSQPMMFGEGLGNSLGLEGPKYVAGRIHDPVVEAKYDEEEEERKRQEKIRENRKRGSEKAKVTRARNVAIKGRIRDKESKGEFLVGQRVFRCLWETEWDKVADSGYGRPDILLDVAKTRFAVLIMLRVFEEQEGKEQGFGNPMTDKVGRKFFISKKDKDHVERLFGRVDWSPLTENEARQFGVNF